MGWDTIKRYQVVFLLGLLFPCTVVSGPNLGWEEAQLRSNRCLPSITNCISGLLEEMRNIVRRQQ